jgi:hypothetical protein
VTTDKHQQVFDSALIVAMAYESCDVDLTNQASTQLANQLALMQPGQLKTIRAAARVLLNAASSIRGVPTVCLSKSCPSKRCPCCGHPDGRPTLAGPAGEHRHGRYRCPEPGCQHSPYGHGDNPVETTRLSDEWMSWTNGKATR